jgi:hypothetical protein
MLGRGRHASANVDDRGHRDLIAAARAAGVKRFVYVSAYGARPTIRSTSSAPSTRSSRSLAASGLDAVVLRPTAFMEQHVHLFNGRNVLEKGKARLIGPGTKPRNFVCAEDVARSRCAPCRGPAAVSPPRDRRPGHYSNADVAALYAKIAAYPAARRTCRGVAAALSVLARPLHPGVARILRILSLPDDAFPSASRAASTSSATRRAHDDARGVRAQAGRGGGPHALLSVPARKVSRQTFARLAAPPTPSPWARSCGSRDIGGSSRPGPALALPPRAGARPGEGLERALIERDPLVLPLRVPLHAERERRRGGGTHALDQAVLGPRLGHQALGEAADALAVAAS